LFHIYGICVFFRKLEHPNFICSPRFCK
jgi:hypothetical protein